MRQLLPIGLASAGLYLVYQSFGKPSQGSTPTRILLSDGRTKVITPEAAHWLARMADAETWGNPTKDDVDYMVWTLLNRQALWSFFDWDWVRFIRGYSQPIHSGWLRDGVHCRKYYPNGVYNGELDHLSYHGCQPRYVNKRYELLGKSWDQVSPIAKDAVNRIMSGETPNPLRAGTVGWFGKGTWASRESNGVNARNGLRETHRVRGNVFYQRTGEAPTSGWARDKVTLIPGTTRI